LSATNGSHIAAGTRADNCNIKFFHKTGFYLRRIKEAN
jgi:hypothetical protein